MKFIVTVMFFSLFLTSFSKAELYIDPTLYLIGSRTFEYKKGYFGHFSGIEVDLQVGDIMPSGLFFGADFRNSLTTMVWNRTGASKDMNDVQGNADYLGFVGGRKFSEFGLSRYWVAFFPLGFGSWDPLQGGIQIKVKGFTALTFGLGYQTKTGSMYKVEGWFAQNDSSLLAPFSEPTTSLGLNFGISLPLPFDAEGKHKKTNEDCETRSGHQ